VTDRTTLRDTLIALGKAQVDAMFARQADDRYVIDDSEFLPLLECVLTAFESHGLDPAGADELWDHAYRVYDRLCREVEPDLPFEANRDLMRRYLLGGRRLDHRRRRQK
jgi:hypothetical protein